MQNKLSIIVPVYNEEKTIYEILNKIKNVQLIKGFEKEILLINDCSKDNTEKKIKEFQNENNDLNIVYHKHEINSGKGAAIHTGIKLASGKYTIIQDADTEYDPEEFNIMLAPAIKGFADVVYGSRFNNGNPHRILFFWHTIGNKFLTFTSNVFTNLNLSDMETCYKLFDTSILKGLKLQEKRFGFEPEITARISRIPGIRIYEVGISYYGRTYKEGKKINWKDGFKAIYCILKYNIFSK
jgi:glycosyltransferase involved in cell wall biosynthesis